MKELKISAIEEGTVIDHIPSENTFKVAGMLGLEKSSGRVVVASNLDSRKLGKKGMIKISRVFLDGKDVQKLALIAPNATVSVIKKHEVADKSKLVVPDVLEGIVRCLNPACITNMENVQTVFVVESKKPLGIRCRHCERLMEEKDISLL